MTLRMPALAVVNELCAPGSPQLLHSAHKGHQPGKQSGHQTPQELLKIMKVACRPGTLKAQLENCCVIQNLGEIAQLPKLKVSTPRKTALTAPKVNKVMMLEGPELKRVPVRLA
eukprot:4274917-Amphidinium_carterae.1